MSIGAFSVCSVALVRAVTVRAFALTPPSICLISLKSDTLYGMATYRCVPLDSPAANRLAEMQGIVVDLERVAHCVQRFLDTKDPLDIVASGCVATAAVVLYARCFTTGTRPKIPESVIESLPDRLRAQHFLIRNLRDKYLAHSVNAFELNRTTVCVPDSPTPGWEPDATALGLHHHWLACPPKKLMVDLSKLASEVRRGVMAWVESEKPLVLEEVRRIPVADLCKRSMVALGPTKWEDAAKRR
jgi:hypothetical protein